MQAAFNVKCEVDVAWDAVGGPVVSQDSMQHLLGLLDALAEHKAHQPTHCRGGKSSSAQSQQQQGRLSATPSRPPRPARGMQQEHVAEQTGTQQRASGQRVASRQRHTPQQAVMASSKPETRT